MRENWQIGGAEAFPLDPSAAAEIESELAERLARRPSPRHVPLLLYGMVCFTLGIAFYLVGVLMVFPRYLGLEPWLGPVSHAIVWYSGIPIVAGLGLAATDLLFFLDRKRPDLPVRYQPVRNAMVTVALTAYNDEESIGPAVADFSPTRSSGGSSSSATTAPTPPSSGPRLPE